ncbi:MAG: CPBP family intramembrane metalloprotease [Candidatus Omnitrophica bacterium]|nr:CPBP family intramembrane metalloprotease [Candidatus Omnitrophota bacterium]
MSRLSGFLKRERLYILLLVFVTIVTALILFTPSDKVKPSVNVADKPASVMPGEKASSDREAVEKALAKNKYLSFTLTLISLLVIALFLLGVIIDTLLILSRSERNKADISTYKAQKAKWGIWDVFKVVILYLFFVYILLISETSLVRVFKMLKDDNFRMILNTSIMDILGIAFILNFVVVQYKTGLISLGLSVKNFFRNVYYGIVAYIALIPVLIGIISVIAIVISLTKYSPQKQAVVELFFKEKDVSFLLYTSLFAAVAGPIVEEIFFRGFLYSAIKKYIGIFWATLISAACFALLHAHLVGFLPILALGILLAYLYEKTGTLVSSVTVHMIHNIGMVLLVFLVKQLGVY